MNEKTFQAISRYGAILVALALIANWYLVMRNRELYRDVVSHGQQFQELAMRQQALQGLLQEVASRAGNNPTVVDILQRHRLISGTPAPAPGPGTAAPAPGGIPQP